MGPAPWKNCDGSAPLGEPKKVARALSRKRVALGSGMADVVRVDTALSPKRLLERKNDGHSIDARTNRLGPLFPPGPDLRSSVPEDAHPPGVQARRKTRVELRIVHEQRRAHGASMRGA
jgi:hypothetical protein